MSFQAPGLRAAGKTKLLLAAVVAAGAALALSSTSAKADATIYQNTFNSGTTSENLIGSTVSGTTTKWGGDTSGVALTTKSSNAYAAVTTYNINNNSYAYLPISGTMLSDYTQLAYTVTLTPTGETSGGLTGDWLSMGFGKGETTSDSTAGGELWALYREDGGTQFFTKGGTTGGGTDGGTSSTSNSADTITITLDTAASATPGAYTITDSQGLFTGVTGSTGTLPTTVYDGIGGIFIGNTGGANGTFASLTLSGSPVPEPASIGLFGLGAVGLLLARRKRA